MHKQCTNNAQTMHDHSVYIGANNHISVVLYVADLVLFSIDTLCFLACLVCPRMVCSCSQGS